MRNVSRNIAFILGITFIAFLVGSAATVVGDVVCEASEVGELFEWHFPLLVSGLIGIPFVLGFIAGQDNY